MSLQDVFSSVLNPSFRLGIPGDVELRTPIQIPTLPPAVIPLAKQPVGSPFASVFGDIWGGIGAGLGNLANFGISRLGREVNSDIAQTPQPVIVQGGGIDTAMILKFGGLALAGVAAMLFMFKLADR